METVRIVGVSGSLPEERAGGERMSPGATAYFL
jgi:hypothetical protein